MALESGTYIDALVASNPVSTDGLAQADDHLRLIKSTIKSTFPGITGAVTATHGDLNGFDGRLTTVEAKPFGAVGIVGGATVVSTGSTADAVRTAIGVGPAQSPSFLGTTAVNSTATNLNIGVWQVSVVGSYLVFKASGVVVFRISTSGTIEARDNVGAFVTGM